MKFRPRQNISLIPFIICKQQNRDFLLNNYEPSLRSRSVLWRRSSFSFFFLVFSAPFQEGNGAEKTKKKNEKGRTTQKNKTVAKETK